MPVQTWNWICGHEAAAGGAECYSELAANAHKLATDNAAMRDLLIDLKIARPLKLYGEGWIRQIEAVLAGDGNARPAMTDERFNQLLAGPLTGPLPMFTLTRVVLALRSVIEATGAKGAQALEAYCTERQARDDWQGEA